MEYLLNNTLNKCIIIIYLYLDRRILIALKCCSIKIKILKFKKLILLIA